MTDSLRSVRTDENNPIWESAVHRENSLYARGNSIRSEFERDYTRLLHCESYRRLKHKTQVFFAAHNDHVCTRMEHVSHVASVSTTIAKYLGLNAELTQAIAIGHDLGHAPFGHTGEEILNELVQNKKEGRNAPKKFWHERNSLFFADYIDTLADPDGTERNLDLTYAVRDGLICHCGEIDQQGIVPRKECMDLYDIKRPGQVQPYTWEGCIVKVSDKIAFLGRDLEDARTYHLLDMASYRELRQIVVETLGFAEGEAGGAHRSGRAVNTTVLINDMIVDLCDHSSVENGISFSRPYFDFIVELKKFCYSNIYNHWRLVEFQNYARDVLGTIYRALMRIMPYAQNRKLDQCLRYTPNLERTFLSWCKRYSNYDMSYRKIHRLQTKEVFDVNNAESWEKCVIEYISGMTDQYAISVFEEILSF